MTKKIEEDAEEFEFDMEGEDEDSKSALEVIDDTPPEDRGRTPMPKEVVDDFEADELEEYSEKVKTRLKQGKKLYHDERREKERVLRENQEAVNAASRLLEENRRLKTMLSTGEQTLLQSLKTSVSNEALIAERDLREAYQENDPDKIVDAQRKLSAATIRSQQLETYQPNNYLQAEDNQVQNTSSQVQYPTPDAKATAWQESNTWFGTDQEMTATALGLHQKLIGERGAQYAGTDEYWQTIDKTMRRRFADYFGEDEAEDKPREAKPTVVAPASRSRSPKKITLKKTQLELARKLGITPEQYAKELMKLEN